MIDLYIYACVFLQIFCFYKIRVYMRYSAAILVMLTLPFIFSLTSSTHTFTDRHMRTHTHTQTRYTYVFQIYLLLIIDTTYLCRKIYFNEIDRNIFTIGQCKSAYIFTW